MNLLRFGPFTWCKYFIRHAVTTQILSKYLVLMETESSLQNLQSATAIYYSEQVIFSD